MSRATATPQRVTWAIEQLDLGPSDDVLEVGCGGGHAVTLLCEQLRRGRVTAIDRSAQQVARARERNAAWIASGRARIECVSLVAAPDALGRARFDRVLAINVNAFWTEPAASVAALHELLAPTGRVYLVYEPPSPTKLREMRRTVPERLVEAGLSVEDVRTASFRRGVGICVIACRPR
jgi:cyclopropane fatty-acyl-phospholipid synthase-like methyltransferase